MAAIKNIIRRQTVDLQFNGVGEGFALQQQFGLWCNEKLLPAIEGILEAYALTEHFIKIDTINIEAGITDSGDWEPFLLQEIVTQLKEQVAIETHKTQEVRQISHQTREENFKESLLYFLQNGYLPWWSHVRSKDEFNNQLEEYFHHAARESVTDILPLLNSPSVRTRIANQFSAEAFALFIASLLNVTPQEVEAILEDINAVSHAGSVQVATASGINFKEIVLAHLGVSVSEGILARSIETWLQQETTNGLINLKAAADKKLFSKEFSVILGQEQIKAAKQGAEIQAGKATKTTAAQKQQSRDGTGEAAPARAGGEINPASKTNVEHHGGSKAEAIDKQRPASVKAKEAKDSGEEKSGLSKYTARQLQEGIYIGNAGLVLLTPFLPRLFENLGIMENGRFSSKDSALAILQWLVTGKDDYAEFELVLPKILCGMLPEEAVMIIPILPENFKEEGALLLQSVIEHWSILKNTSLEGLRQSFLQRDGKLSMNNDEWFLQVEQKPYDILLQHLPWSINIIRLPWMQQMLTTEWLG